MKICIYNFYIWYNCDNKLFLSSAYNIGAYLAEPAIELRNKLSELGHEVNTIDKMSLDDFDVFIFLDFPDNNIGLLELLKAKGKKIILWCLESEIIHPSNNCDNNYKYFDFVLTYNKTRINKGNMRLMLIPEPSYNKISTSFRSFNEKKLCTIIAGNKTSCHKNELYTERLKNIIWFTNNCPDDFDLYGTGWEKKLIYIKKITFFKWKKKIFSKKYNNLCYKGQTDKKIETLSKYKFSICFENVKNINGYITEKIFDCFFANCVPIYYGANDISEYIPSCCYIDYCYFKNPKQLFKFLASVSVEEYNNYLNNIKEFLLSDRYKKFNIDSVVSLIDKI